MPPTYMATHCYKRINIKWQIKVPFMIPLLVHSNACKDVFLYRGLWCSEWLFYLSLSLFTT